ncbi:MAG: class I SAM-dependent methyltransferase [Dehalococcoidia bacterium]
MSAQNSAPGEQRVDPAEYTEEYYLTSCEGFDLYRESGGDTLSPRLTHALDLASIETGDRVLDIACGRGEVVLHAARRGARAFGIDYASAAATLARRLLGAAPDGPSLRMAVAQMDATRLGLPDASFDAIFMLDFVEHVYPLELANAFDEARRILKPYGRLVIHTSPNRLFEEVVYARYVRNVHRAVLGVARKIGYRDKLINPIMLGTDPEPPRNEYERRLHVNEQNPDELCRLLQTHGFQSIMVNFWEPPVGQFFDERRYQLELQALDCIRFLRPFSRYWPLNRYFSNHIWITAQRPP